MRNLTKIAAVLLVLLAIVLAGYAWVLGRQPSSSRAPVAGAPPVPQTVPLLVAARPLPAGRILQAEDVRIEQLPVAIAGTLSDPAAAVGRIPTQDIAAGSLVLEAQLASGLAARLAAGERAMAVRVDEASAAGNRVKPGDTVDVFVLLKRDGTEIDNSQARLLLARKRVLAFGSASVDAPAENGGAGSTQRVDAARTAVLAVAVEEVHVLALAESNGRVVLVLRNPSDDVLPDPSLYAALPLARPLRGNGSGLPLPGIDRANGGLTAAALAHGSAAAPPAVAMVQAAAVARLPVATTMTTAVPAGGRTVEIIRGERRELVQY